jgi:hypothetical protein
MLLRLAGVSALGYSRFVPVTKGDANYITESTDVSQLSMIWGFHGGDYDEWRLLGYDEVCFL